MKTSKKHTKRVLKKNLSAAPTAQKTPLFKIPIGNVAQDTSVYYSVVRYFDIYNSFFRKKCACRIILTINLNIKQPPK